MRNRILISSAFGCGSTYASVVMRECLRPTSMKLGIDPEGAVTHQIIYGPHKVLPEWPQDVLCEASALSGASLENLPDTVKLYHQVRHPGNCLSRFQKEFVGEFSKDGHPFGLNEYHWDSWKRKDEFSDTWDMAMAYWLDWNDLIADSGLVKLRYRVEDMDEEIITSMLADAGYAADSELIDRVLSETPKDIARRNEIGGAPRRPGLRNPLDSIPDSDLKPLVVERAKEYGYEW